MSSIKARIANGGRVVIPAEYRRALGIQEGDEVIVSLLDGEVRIVPRLQSLRRAQDIIAKHSHGKKDRSRWSEELIAERRAEASCD